MVSDDKSIISPAIDEQSTTKTNATSPGYAGIGIGRYLEHVGIIDFSDLARTTHPEQIDPPPRLGVARRKGRNWPLSAGN